MIDPKLTRRDALRGAAVLSAATALGCDPATPAGDAGTDAPPAVRDGGPDAPRPMPDAGPPPTGPFQHGVASGDPLADAVILWTRISEATGSVDVEWEVATDPAFGTLVTSGTFSTDAARDHTVKVDATGLSAGTTYYYRFRTGGMVSPIGRTKTAPTGSVSRLRFAVCACSSYAHGYFHGYRHIAERADLDAVIHLGDYIYEYGTGEYGKVREYDPPHEIVTLDDYRRRYRHYRLDRDLQEAHRQHPFITTWDDHESADNSWSGGANNHTEGAEGAWTDRRAAATQAYREWLPFREQPTAAGRLYRSLAYGDLAELIVLDTRISGRTQQGIGAEADRRLLEPDQETFFAERLAASTARWKLVCQQVMVGSIAELFLNDDQWDGYPAQRARFLEQVRDAPVDGVVVLTGDIHTSWANDLVPTGDTYDVATRAGSVAVEFVAPGISSPGFPAALAATFGGIIEDRLPAIRWTDLTQRGYFVLDLDATRAQAAWFHLADVEDWMPEVGGAQAFTAAWSVADGAAHLTEDSAPATPPASPPPLAP